MGMAWHGMTYDVIHLRQMSVGTLARLPPHRDVSTSRPDFDLGEGDLRLFSLSVDDGRSAGERGLVHRLGPGSAYVDDDVYRRCPVDKVFGQCFLCKLMAVFLDEHAEDVCCGFCFVWCHASLV